MRLRLLHAGAPARGPLAEAAAEYAKRLGRYARYEEVLVRPVKGGPVAEALAKEAERLRSRLKPREAVVALAVDGDAVDSEGLARRVERWQTSGRADVALLLGSAHGLDPGLVTAAEWRWSLGPLTLPHDLARVVVVEQLYRAMTILRGEPYHKA